jgi:hypothetical protein
LSRSFGPSWNLKSDMVLTLEAWQRRVAGRKCILLHMISMSGSRTLIFVAVCLVAASISALAQRNQIEPPLHTSGYQILNAAGHPVRITSVNWFGFDEKEYVAGGLDHAPLAVIVKQIQEIGVNAVRLPWANETFEHNPLVPD